MEELELRAAARGDLTRRPQPQQWVGSHSASAAQPEQLFYIDSQVSSHVDCMALE